MKTSTKNREERIEAENVILSPEPMIDNDDKQYHCPDPNNEGCDYSHDKFTSVRSHCLRSHKVWLVLNDDNSVAVGKKGEKTKESPLREEPKEEGFFEPREQTKEPFTRMPDVLQSLWEHSRKFGLSKKGSDTFIEAMKTRDVDDLEEMELVLRDMRCDASTINLLIDNWARSRGLYRQSTRRLYDNYGRRIAQEEESLPTDETDEMIDREYKRATKLRVIKELRRDTESQRPYDGTDELRTEIRDLREKLLASEKRRLEDKLDGVMAEVKELKVSAQTGRTESDALVEAIHGLERVLIALTGSSVQPPKRERIGQPEIISLVPSEMVE